MIGFLNLSVLALFYDVKGFEEKYDRSWCLMENLAVFAEKVDSAFKAKNSKKLRKLVDDILTESAGTYAKAAYELAVITYVLSKILSKSRFQSSEYDGGMAEVDRLISVAAKELAKRSDQGRILEIFKQTRESIRNLDKEDQRFLNDLVVRGKTKIAAILYAQGMSLGTASELAGIAKQDIMDYAGKTMMFDRMKEEVSVRDRLKVAKRLMGGS
ncbi:MAG: hypothetical protein ACP5NX_01810 [Candidatus Bilamarchaeaceae archaeon]